MILRRLGVLAPLLVVVVVACKGSTTPVVAETVPASSTAATATATATVTVAGEAPQKVCMMVNVCSCNLGCAAIRVPKSAVRAGTHAKAESGALQGQELKIVETHDVTGAKVLALTDLDHDHTCSFGEDKRYLGYGCSAKDSGAIPANACASGCNE